MITVSFVVTVAIGADRDNPAECARMIAEALASLRGAIRRGSADGRQSFAGEPFALLDVAVLPEPEEG